MNGRVIVLEGLEQLSSLWLDEEAWQLLAWTTADFADLRQVTANNLPGALPEGDFRLFSPVGEVRREQGSIVLLTEQPEILAKQGCLYDIHATTSFFWGKYKLALGGFIEVRIPRLLVGDAIEPSEGSIWRADVRHYLDASGACVFTRFTQVQSIEGEGRDNG